MRPGFGVVTWSLGWRAFFRFEGWMGGKWVLGRIGMGLDGQAEGDGLVRSLEVNAEG
jgi:hypothetical protein